MAKVRLNGEQITDWTAFHTQCKAVFGFPDFYAGSMDAWIDCLSYLRDDEGMTRFRLEPEEMLEIEITHSEILRQQAPEILDEVAFCIETINERYADYGEKPALKLVMR